MGEYSMSTGTPVSTVYVFLTGCVVAAAVDAACVAAGATVAILACKPPLPTTPAFRTYDGPPLKVALALAGRLAGITATCSSVAEAVAL